MAVLVNIFPGKGPSFKNALSPDKRVQMASRWPALVAVFSWPLIYYYHCIIPSMPFSLAVGNDFDALYHNYKVYLLDLLVSGHFPLWSPSEAAGFPFYSSPFTQAFYPLNIPLAAWYGIAGGYSIFDGQLFTVLGYSVFAVGLYLWLELIVPCRRAVLFGVLVAAISFKLGEIIRFPNAVHAAAWMPWLLYGLTLAALGRLRLAGLVLFAASLMLLTAGYPYYTYYCLFLVPPYMVMLMVPGSRRALMPGLDTEFSSSRFLVAGLAGPLIAALVTLPFHYKTWQLMSQTVDRSAGGYDYATEHIFFLSDVLGSLVFPPAAQTEGWYYFGLFGVLLLAAFCSRAFSEPLSCSSDRAFVWLVTGWILVITYITFGRHSYLFDVLWSYLPGFSRLRAWGRLNIVLVPIFALFLARAYWMLESALSGTESEARRKQLHRMIVAVVAATVCVAGAQAWLLWTDHFDFYWRHHFKHLAGIEPRFMAATVVAFVVLTGSLLIARRRPLADGRALWAFLVLAVMVSACDLRPVGAVQWMCPAGPAAAVRKPLNMMQAIERSLLTPRKHEEDSTIALDAKFHTGFMINWYFERYLAFHRRVFSSERFGLVADSSELPWFRKLMGLEDGRRFFFSRGIGHGNIAAFIRDAATTQGELAPALRVVSYNGDRLVVETLSPEPLYLSFIDNWDPDWQASIDGRPARLHLLFGTFKSVVVPPGTSRVTMEYKPFL